MVKIDSKYLNINEKEFTAYIQQQMADLQPHLTDKASLQVRLTEVGKGQFEAEVTAFQEEGEVQTIGRNSDPFDAIRNAKDGLLEYFVEMEAELNPHLRDQKINHLARNGNLYLH